VSLKPWQERVQEILAALVEIETFIAGFDRQQFLCDAKTQKAVVANLTIIGEAARHVPESIAGGTSEVPWTVMRGMRNQVVHGYYQVDPVIVWETCQNDLPPLIAPLEKLLCENPAA
jgi:uncharacterized protein with HEPN domain